MNTDIPYMLSVTNLHKILEAIQRASAPEVFHQDFLKDLGFKASNDRGAVKVLKYLKLLDESGRPLAAYREFMNQQKAKQVLATQIRIAFDDLFTSDRTANTKTVDHLKGWFKTKTGTGDSVAQKIASTFRSLATYADFDTPHLPERKVDSPATTPEKEADEENLNQKPNGSTASNQNNTHKSQIGLVYRFEINLPDTQNVDTYRAIFRALREELM